MGYHRKKHMKNTVNKTSYRYIKHFCKKRHTISQFYAKIDTSIKLHSSCSKLYGTFKAERYHNSGNNTTKQINCKVPHKSNTKNKGSTLYYNPSTVYILQQNE